LKIACVLTALAGIYLLSSDGGAVSPLALSVRKFELLAVFGAMLSGFAIVLVKKLHDTDSTYAIFFAQCAIGLWLVIIPANVVSVSIGYSGGVILLCIGIIAATGQLLMTEGYRHVTVIAGSLLGMLVPVLNFTAGTLIFHEHLSLQGFVGAGIVVLSCIFVIITDTRNTARNQKGQNH